MNTTPATTFRGPLGLLFAASAAVLVARSAQAQESTESQAMQEEFAAESAAEESAESTSEFVAVPRLAIAEVTSWRMHGEQAQSIQIELDGTRVTSEPRVGGIQDLRIRFNQSAQMLGEIEVNVEAKAGCDPGRAEDYAEYSMSPSVDVLGDELVLSFAPLPLSSPSPLANAHAYRITLSDGGALPEQSFEVRSLIGDVNSDGRTDSTDRSALVGVWTSGAYLPQMDVNLDGRINAYDRTRVVDAWTGSANCAP